MQSHHHIAAARGRTPAGVVVAVLLAALVLVAVPTQAMAASKVGVQASASARSHAATLHWSVAAHGHRIKGVHIGRVGTTRTRAWRSTLIRSRAGTRTVKGLPNGRTSRLYVQPVVDGKPGPRRYVKVTARAWPLVKVAASARDGSAKVTWRVTTHGHRIPGVRVGRVGTRGVAPWTSGLTRSLKGSRTVTGLPNGKRSRVFVQPVVDGRRGAKRYATVTPAAATPRGQADVPVTRPALVSPQPSLRLSTSATDTTATVTWGLDAGGQNVDGVLVGRDGVSSTGFGAWQSTLLPAEPATKTMTKLVPGTAYTVHVTPVVGGVAQTPVTARVRTTAAAEPEPASPTPGEVLLGHWDTSTLRLGPAGLSNYRANEGVNEAMSAALGRTGGVSQIMKAYDSTWRWDYAKSAVARSAEFGHAFAITMPAPGGGGNPGYRAVLSGSQDAAIDAFFRSVPASETAYVMLQNEADNPKKGTDADLYDRALAHVVNRAAPIYAERGLKGAVGPVFMGGQFLRNSMGPEAYFQKWNFIQYLDESAKPYALYALDCYSKYTSDDASTYESIPATVNRAFSRARALGVTRFAIPEFANSLEKRNAGGKIVGTRATQQKWVTTEVPKIKAIPGLEFAVYFHKPTGPESKNAQLLDTTTAKPFTAYAKQF